MCCGRGSQRCFRQSRRSPRADGPGASNRAALTGILFVLKTGIPWEYLPAEMECASGMTCWRRLHQVLLEELAQADRIDWDRAPLDSAAVPAPGAKKTGKNPTDRGKQGTKRHPVSTPTASRSRSW